jgi:hypothetical protein
MAEQEGPAALEAIATGTSSRAFGLARPSRRARGLGRACGPAAVGEIVSVTQAFQPLGRWSAANSSLVSFLQRSGRKSCFLVKPCGCHQKARFPSYTEAGDG